MKRKLKDFYGAHPIRRTLLTIVILVLLLGLVYFYPAFSLKAAPVPAVQIPRLAKGAEIPAGEKVTVNVEETQATVTPTTAPVQKPSYGGMQPSATADQLRATADEAGSGGYKE